MSTDPIPTCLPEGQGPAGCRGRGRPRGADTTSSPDLQTLLPSGRGPAAPRDRAWGPPSSVRGSAPWSSSPGGMGRSQDQGLEGQKHLPALPGHVRSQDAQAETIIVVSGSLMTRPGPHEGPGDGDHLQHVAGSRTRLPSLRGAGQMLAQTRSAHSCPGSSCDDVTQAAQGSGALVLVVPGPRQQQESLGLAGDCHWRHRTARPAEGWTGHKVLLSDSKTGRGRERDPAACPPLLWTSSWASLGLSVLTRDTAVPPVKVLGPRDPV